MALQAQELDDPHQGLAFAKSTWNPTRHTRDQARIDRLLYPEGGSIKRPKTRAECPESGPCPYVSCRHHLWASVGKTGSVTTNFAGEVWNMRYTCSLDFADKGPLTLESCGQLFGVTRERIRQIEEMALDSFVEAAQKLYPDRKPDDWFGDGLGDRVEKTSLKMGLMAFFRENSTTWYSISRLRNETRRHDLKKVSGLYREGFLERRKNPHPQTQGDQYEYRYLDPLDL